MERTGIENCLKQLYGLKQIKKHEKCNNLESILGEYPVCVSTGLKESEELQLLLKLFFKKQIEVPRNILSALKNGDLTYQGKNGEEKIYRKLHKMLGPNKCCDNANNISCGSCYLSLKTDPQNWDICCEKIFNLLSTSLSQQAINSKKKWTLIISASPLDMLTPSNFTADVKSHSLRSRTIETERTSWDSCHRFGGQYMSGNRFWQKRENTVVAYLTDGREILDEYLFKHYSCNETLPRKFARCWLHYENGMLLMDRVYPDVLWTKIMLTAFEIIDLDVNDFYNDYQGQIEIPYEDIDIYKKYTPFLDSYVNPDCAHCVSCGDALNEDEEHSFEDDIYCQECYDRYVSPCFWCENDYWRENMVEVDQELYCSNCIDMHFTQCEVCSEYIRDDDIIVYERENYCENCYEENFFQCSACNEFYHKTGSGDDDICVDCLEETEETETEETRINQ